MRTLLSIPLALGLAAFLHADWHFARPLHHRLSLDWSSHWLGCIAVFALAGWFIARRWPERRWAAAAWNVGIAIVIAQLIEPVLETAYYDGMFVYDVEPARWAAFWQCIGAGLPALGAVLLLFRRRLTGTRSRTAD